MYANIGFIDFLFNINCLSNSNLPISSKSDTTVFFRKLYSFLLCFTKLLFESKFCFCFMQRIFRLSLTVISVTKLLHYKIRTIGVKWNQNYSIGLWPSSSFLHSAWTSRISVSYLISSEIQKQVLIHWWLPKLTFDNTRRKAWEHKWFNDKRKFSAPRTCSLDTPRKTSKRVRSQYFPLFIFKE